MGEQPIFATKAHIFQIDPETKKKWIPVSTQAATVSFYHDSIRNSYRIISLDGTKVMVNSTILSNMTFAKTSQKFGQWADHRVNTIYGLGFNSEVDLIHFMEKFNEVKELTKASLQSAAPNDVKLVPVTHSNGSDSSVTSTSTTARTDLSQHIGDATASVQVSQPSLQTGSELLSLTSDLNRSASSVTANSQLFEQLKYDNERLKIALAQSSANAKKWEQDLQTLRNNNTRLTTALQESNTNVEEWKKQLAAYRDENTRLKTKLTEVEKSSGNIDLLQHQLIEYKTKLEDNERLSQRKEEEVNDLKRKVDELKQVDIQTQKLTVKLQVLEEEKLKMRKQLTEVQQQLDQTQSESKAGRQQLLAAQQQLSAKINELYEMNDKLADLLQSTTTT